MPPWLVGKITGEKPETVPPELSLANVDKLEEFWKYNVDCIVKNKINMLWVIGFRGNGDHPFWYTFKDAPADMKARGEVISQMMEKQRQIVIAATANYLRTWLRGSGLFFQAVQKIYG